MLADALVEKELDLLVAPDGNLEACILVAWTTATKISLVQGRRMTGDVTSEINLIPGIAKEVVGSYGPRTLWCIIR